MWPVVQRRIDWSRWSSSLCPWNECLATMSDKVLWHAGPAVFSVIGMMAGYLHRTEYTIPATVAGFCAGFILTCFAMAGEKTRP